MTATNIYADDFTRQFWEESQLMDFLHKIEQSAAWGTLPSAAMQFIALEKGTLLIDGYKAEYDLEGKASVIDDTLENTALMLRLDSGIYPVRSCAIKTILDRARISGNALSKVAKPVLADILNQCLRVASGDALYRISEDKVSAVHGGDSSDYAVLEMPALLERTINHLNAHFPGYRFAGGSYDHSLFTASWALGGNDELLAAYKEALMLHEVPFDNIKPALRLASSDVGISGANLFPTLHTGNGNIISLGNPLKLEHRAGATLERFDEQLDMIYAQYKSAIGALEKLLYIEIANPVNCMGGVMKRIGIPKKLAFHAMDLFGAQYGASACTAHNLYYGINEVIFMLQCDGASGTRVAQMEETVARALSVRWSDYDMPGEFKW